MKITRKVTLEQDVQYLHAIMHVRYWVDCDYSADNGKTWLTAEDTTEDNAHMQSIIPCVKNANWDITIDLSHGKVLNWPKGICLNTFFKICDEGEYIFLDKNKKVVCNITEEYNQYYVPDFMELEDVGFGDYVYLNIDGAGRINNFDVMQDRITEYFEDLDHD